MKHMREQQTEKQKTAIKDEKKKKKALEKEAKAKLSEIKKLEDEISKKERNPCFSSRRFMQRRNLFKSC